MICEESTLIDLLTEDTARHRSFSCRPTARFNALVIRVKQN